MTETTNVLAEDDENKIDEELLEEIQKNGLTPVKIAMTDEALSALKEKVQDISPDAQYLGIGIGDYVEEDISNISPKPIEETEHA